MGNSLTDVVGFQNSIAQPSFRFSKTVYPRRLFLLFIKKKNILSAVPLLTRTVHMRSYNGYRKMLSKVCHDRRALICDQSSIKSPCDKWVASPIFYTVFHPLSFDIHLNDLILKVNNRRPPSWRATYILFHVLSSMFNWNFCVRLLPSSR